jgi:NAD(P)-dependent dehydrogenase (short-subunit alcohol dehydrogenase family)
MDQNEHAPASDLSVDLRGSTAVVIGATSGIGRAIALRLAAAGARVVATARERKHLDETASLAGSAGHELHAEVVDVAVPESISRLADRVTDRYGVPRTLVNSAGVMIAKPAFELTVKEWDLVHAVQLRGPFLTSQAFGRAMADVGYGNIINLSSTWAFTVGEGRSAYAAAKAGVTHLTAALAAEWGPLGVRVNAIAPAATRTPVVDRRLADHPGREEYLLARLPLRRLATPEDIASCALFLASHASDFVTGETILVDGGWRTSK